MKLPFFYCSVSRSRNALKIGFLKKKPQILRRTRECAFEFTAPPSNACAFVWARLLSLSTQSCWGCCHQPCLSLLALSPCVGADGMAASQAQLQHQICFLSIMPNYGKETNPVYMLSLVGQGVDEKCHTLSLFHTDTHFMLWLYLNDTHRGVPVRCCCCAECNGGRLAGTPHHDVVKPDEMKYIPIMICRWGCGREKKKNSFRNR